MDGAKPVESVGPQPRGGSERGPSPSGETRRRQGRPGSPAPATKDDMAVLAASLHNVQRELDLERREREIDRERSMVEREKEAVRRERAEDRRRQENIQRFFLDWLGRNEYFAGVEITSYLRRFELGMRVLHLTDEELSHYFLMTADPKVEAKARAALAGAESWFHGKAKLRTVFAASDRGRATAMSFAAWIRNPAKEQQTPEDVLIEFEKQYEELEEDEQLAFANRIKHFIQALPDGIRLAFSEPLYDETQMILVASWEQVRRRARGFTARLRDAAGPGVVEGKGSSKDLSGPHQAGPNDRTSMTEDPRLEELTKRMSEMAATLHRLAGSQDRVPFQARPDRCIFCDVLGHRRDVCESFRRAAAQGVARIVNGRVCRRDGTEIPARFGRGGMRQTLIEEGNHPCGATGVLPPAPPLPNLAGGPIRSGAQGFSNAVTAPWEARSTDRKGDRCDEMPGSSEVLPRSPGELQGYSSFDVACNAVTDVFCEEKRAGPEAERLADKRPRTGPWPSQPQGMAARSRTDGVPVARVERGDRGLAHKAPAGRAGRLEDGSTKDAVKLESVVGKGFDLSKFVDQAILGQTVSVTIRELLAACQQGAGGVPGTLGDALRRRRVAGANYCELGLDLDGEQDSSEDSAQRDVGAYHQRAGHPDKIEGLVDRRRYPAKASLWARPVSETSIYIPGLGRSVQALIDSGSEVNLVEQWLAEEAGWQVIADPGWTLHTATGKEPILGAAPNAAVEIASVETCHNFFVQRRLGYPMILGQPWRARVNYRSIWKWDGSEVGEVTSPDNRVATFAVVRPADPRHRDQLTREDELEDDEGARESASGERIEDSDF
jgi:hypothetical protein